MKQLLTEYIRAGYPGIYLVSHEETRVRECVRAACIDLSRRFLIWSCTSGLIEFPVGAAPTEHRLDKGGSEPEPITDPLDALEFLLKKLPNKTIVAALDFHLFLENAQPTILRKLKDVLFALKQQSKTFVIVAGRLELPPELEKEMLVLDFALPGRDELRTVLQNTLTSAKRAPLEPAVEAAVLRAAGGLTTDEAENAFALSIIRHGHVRPEVVAKEKAATVKKAGLLEVIDTDLNMDSVGGLDDLKNWTAASRQFFTEEAAAAGNPAPKGCLVVGLPGTGKSLLAAATANILGFPLLQMNAASVFGSLVGESERNMKRIQQTAEAVAPCVLRIDELEKLFSGSGGDTARSDGGVGDRVFGSFLTWMQERKAPVFVIATANDVEKLPPALLRRGRWDEIWFVDLPTPSERESIWRVVIRKQYTATGPRRDPAQFDLPALAAASEGFVGAEIEQAFIEASRDAYAAKTEPATAHIVTALQRTNPLSKFMKAQLQKTREKMLNNSRNASSAPATTVPALSAGYGRAIDEAPPISAIVVVTPGDTGRQGAN